MVPAFRRDPRGLPKAHKSDRIVNLGAAGKARPERCRAPGGAGVA
jgi:hypothetical protein